MLTQALTILDDCFSLTVFKEINDYFDREQFSFIHDGYWRRVFRISDGNCLKGPEYFSRSVPGQDFLSFPSGKSVDHVIKFIHDKQTNWKSVIGEIGDTWDVFSIRPYICPAGTGLSWHDDKGYAGAFIFYAHTSWQPSWGGELMLRNSVALSSNADGLFVEPKPNRMVIFRSGIQHAIKKVEHSAGESCRMSLTGFFYKEALLA